MEHYVICMQPIVVSDYTNFFREKEKKGGGVTIPMFAKTEVASLNC